MTDARARERTLSVIKGYVFRGCFLERFIYGKKSKELTDEYTYIPFHQVCSLSHPMIGAIYGVSLFSCFRWLGVKWWPCLRYCFHQAETDLFGFGYLFKPFWKNFWSLTTAICAVIHSASLAPIICSRALLLFSKSGLWSRAWNVKVSYLCLAFNSGDFIGLLFFLSATLARIHKVNVRIHS